MVGKIIRDYMEGGGRKLTVPGFGTFMRRDGGEVIFVDLLRGDDRTLAEMVEDAGPMGEVEAMARIDRFIFETKNAIERTGRSAIAGFGTLTVDGKGIYRFDYSPSPAAPLERAVERELFDAPASEGRGAASPRTAPGGDRQTAAIPGEGRRNAATPYSTPQAATRRPDAPQGGARGAAPGGTQPHPQDGTQPTRVGPQPRPQNDTRPRQQVGPGRESIPTGRRDNPAEGRAPQRRPGERRPAQGRKPQEPRSPMDRVLLIAIIAAAVALAAMIFGLTASAGGPFMNN